MWASRPRVVTLCAAAAVAAALSVAPAAAAAAAAEAPRVTLADGLTTLRGVSVEGGAVDAFLGVRFGQAPVGTLRFAPPVPPAPPAQATEVAAEAYGAPCVQQPGRTLQGQDEDCLFLNVWKPAAAAPNSSDASTAAATKTSSASELLPVMLWVYGGCWDFGAGSDPLYDGSRVVAERASAGKDAVVLVNLNYRLGPLGFLGGEAVRAADGSTGNWGLQDQRLAMDWVRRNIAQFGGDPARVMVYGESAGAGSTSCHLVSKPSAGLFSRAVMESGPFASWIASTSEVAEAQSKSYAEACACGSADNDAEAAAVAECLRKAPLSTLTMQWKTGCPPESTCCWNPTIDGVNLEKDPRVLAAEGRFPPDLKGVALGSNKNEGSLFMYKYKSMVTSEATLREALKLLFVGMPASVIDDILKLYPLSDFRSPWWALAEIMGDVAFSCPARLSARWLSRASKDRFSTNLYFFTHVTSGERGRTYGAYHGTELPYVFDVAPGHYLGLDFEPTPAEIVLQHNVSTIWSGLAAQGPPSFWPPYTNSTDLALQINEQFDVVPHLKQARCDFFEPFIAHPRSN